MYHKIHKPQQNTIKMELKEFIKTALADIVNGVKNAASELNEDVAMCPQTDKTYNGFPSITYKMDLREKQAPITVVGFKVMVQVEETETAGAKATAGVLNVLGGGIDGKASSTSATTQELTFSIPIVWKKMR